MRAFATLIFCATLPFAAGFAFSGAHAQGMQYEGPGGIASAPVPPQQYPSQPFTPSMGVSGDQTRMSQLEQQLRDLTNQLEQRDFQLRQLQASFDKYVADSAQRFSSLEEKLSGTITGTGQSMPADSAYTPPAPSPATPSSAAVTDNSGPVPGTLDDPNAPYKPNETPPLGQITENVPGGNGGNVTSGRPQGSSSAGGPAQAYDQAFSYLQQSNYTDAQRAFSEFLKNHATHPLAANAQYWLGETYFAQTQYSTAAKTFAKAFQEHPQGQKAPDALLKLALTLEKMNKKDDACLTLGELKKRFPSGPASVLGRGTEEGLRMGCKG